MQVGDIVEQKGTRIVAAGPETTVDQIARILEEESVGAALVRADDGAVLGIVSERDIVHSIARRGSETLALKASDLMTSSVVTCDPSADLEDLMETMLSARIRHLPVIQEEELVAVVSIGDVVGAVTGELKWMRTALQDQVVKLAAWATEEEAE